MTRRAAAALAVASAALSCAGPRRSLHAWVVVGPGGIAVARAAVEEPARPCPRVRVGREGTARIVKRMRERLAGGIPGAYPEAGQHLRVCEAALPDGATQWAVEDGGAWRPLPVPRPVPRRVVVLGDTGCKLKRERAPGGEPVYIVQNCNNVPGLAPAGPLSHWPFRKIALAAARLEPDLVLHLGDYVYSKLDCARLPSGERHRERACRGYPSRMRWATMRAELFEPARALLARAPWVVPRGNHENCNPGKAPESQGGLGFFLLLDPRPASQLLRRQGSEIACATERTPPYRVPIGPELDLWIVDSNEPEDEARAAVPALAGAFSRQLRELAATARPGTRAWLVTHRPLYALYPGKRKRLLGKGAEPPRPQPLNVTLQLAYQAAEREGALPVDLALGGHMHLFQKVSFADGRHPVQIVAGNGGTLLDAHFPASLDRFAELRLAAELRGPGDVAWGPPLQVRGWTWKRYGFLVLDRGDTAWTVTLHDEDGGVVVRWRLEGRRMTRISENDR